MFKTAILSNALIIIVFHNHPSGETEPSQQDIQLTHRLVEVGKLVTLELLEHPI